MQCIRNGGPTGDDGNPTIRDPPSTIPGFVSKPNCIARGPQCHYYYSDPTNNRDETIGELFHSRRPQFSNGNVIDDLLDLLHIVLDSDKFFFLAQF